MSNTQYIPYGGTMMIFLNTGSTLQPAAFSTSAKLNVSMKPRDVSSKDSGDWTEKVKGRFDWNASSDQIANFQTTGTTLSLDDVYAFFKAGNPVNISFASKTGTSPGWTVDASKKKFNGTALIVAMDVNAPDGDNCTYSIQLEGSGELVLA